MPRGPADVNPARVRWALLALSALGFACGPTRSTALIVEAAAEVAAAQTAQAPGIAPYEFIAAEHYLHKAREEQSYADFEVAEKMAKKARDCARLARSKAEDKTRSDIGASAARSKANVICRAGPVSETGERRAIPKDEVGKTAKKPAVPAVVQPPPPAEDKPKTPVKPKDEPGDPMPEGDE